MSLSGKDRLNILFMLTSAGLLVYGPMASELGGPGNVFTYHPFFMGLGFTLMMTMGFWMFNYEDLPGGWADTRAARRRLHATFQLAGVALVAVGYFAIVRAHLDTGARLFAVSDHPVVGFHTGPMWARTAHVFAGYLALVLLVIQVSLGMWKYFAVAIDDGMSRRGFSPHELVGNTVYVCGLANVLVGVWLWEGWSLALRCLISLTMATSVVFGPRWDGTRGYLSDVRSGGD